MKIVNRELLQQRLALRDGVDHDVDQTSLQYKLAERVNQRKAVEDSGITEEQGTLLPIRKIKKDGEIISRQFDPTAGVVGDVISGFTAPKEVLIGELPQYLSSGELNPEFSGRAFEVGGMITPGANVTRQLPATALAKRQSAEGAAPRISEAGEFGINLDRAQATRDMTDQRFAQDAISGGKGPSASGAFVQNKARQEEQVDKAIEGIIDRSSSGVSHDVGEIADNLAGSLGKEATARKTASQELYKRAGESGAEIEASAVDSLSKRLRATLENDLSMEGDNVSPDLPIVAGIVKRADGLSKLQNEQGAVGWERVEKVRKKINSAKPIGDERRVLGLLKKDMDDWLENSVENALVSGNKQFLNDLKGARSAWSAYKDIVGNPRKVIGKMAEGKMNSTEIGNLIFGASKVGGRADSSNLVKEMKRLIGKDHPAIEDLKRGVFLSLFKNSEGETKALQKIATDIFDLTNGKGRELFKSLYGDENRLELTKFARVLRSLKPEELATNPSRSGQTVLRAARDGLKKILPLMGLATGGIEGGAAGLIGGQIESIFANALAGRTARKMISQPQPKIPYTGSRRTSTRGRTVPLGGVMGQSFSEQQSIQDLVDLLPPGTS